MVKKNQIIRRDRRSKAEISTIETAIYDLLAAENPMTLRQLFYRLVSLSVIEKTEQEYKGTLARLTGKMRMNGDLPFEWLADNTRWMRKPTTYNNLEQMLVYCQQTYRRALWQDQPNYVEVWLEKDALAGVIVDITDKYDVPLMVSRGYASHSYLHSAAKAIERVNKPTHIYYFGDNDPSGKHIPEIIEKRLHTFAPKANINFEVVGVTPQQVRDLKLPTRPTKQTDSRAKNFVGESCEVDAIPPKIFRQMVRDSIQQNLDWLVLEKTEDIENEERDSLKGLLGLNP